MDREKLARRSRVAVRSATPRKLNFGCVSPPPWCPRPRPPSSRPAPSGASALHSRGVVPPAVRPAPAPHRIQPVLCSVPVPSRPAAVPHVRASCSIVGPSRPSTRGPPPLPPSFTAHRARRRPYFLLRAVVPPVTFTVPGHCCGTSTRGPGPTLRRWTMRGTFIVAKCATCVQETRTTFDAISRAKTQGEISEYFT